MTTAFVRLPLALSAASLLAVSPAFARGPVVTVIAPAQHTERVTFQDLNLRDQNARLLLQARVNEASLKVCKATAFPELLDMVERSNCIVNARIGARPQVAAAIARATSGQTFALNTAIQVSAAF
jgi:UrcA family protein